MRENMPNEIKGVSPSELESYWNAISADDLPSGLDIFLLDCALMASPSTAIRWVQRAVRVKPDGVIGPETLGAIREKNPREIIAEIERLRRNSLKSMAQLWAIYGQKWTNHINHAKARALKLC